MHKSLKIKYLRLPAVSKVDNTTSAPEIVRPPVVYKRIRRQSDSKAKAVAKSIGKASRKRVSLSETCLSTPKRDGQCREQPIAKGLESRPSGDDSAQSSDAGRNIKMQNSATCSTIFERRSCNTRSSKASTRDKSSKLSDRFAKNKNAFPRSTSSTSDSDSAFLRKIRAIHSDSRKSARLIRHSRAKLMEIQRKPELTEADIQEIGQRNEMLLREMERFDKLTKNIQKLVGVEVTHQFENFSHSGLPDCCSHTPKDSHENSQLSTAKTPPTLRIPHEIPAHASSLRTPDTSSVRSKSEIDLSRKLSESYDMQERLAADNAELEVKRYILHKELMTKDQNLETCRAQIKRLQGELKLMSKENALLMEQNSMNSPEGDANAMNKNILCTKSCENLQKLDANSDVDRLNYLQKLQDCNVSTAGLESQLGELEFEIRQIQIEMEDVKKIKVCRGGGGSGARNTCFEQSPNSPPVPPLSRECGVCPPCPAPCNPMAPPTPAEKEVERLTTILKSTEENFKLKVTECAMLRADICKKKEELEKERCLHRECQNKLRELEMKFEGLALQTSTMLGTKEQSFEMETSVRALKQCYREAREEIDELRLLLKEQNEQLQGYRVKYLSAQQMVEEQRRQMDILDMDNTRISEQINLEIQKVKIKFQEKLQELAPIPDLLKATQMRLKDAQQSQAIAEHQAEQLARELNCAREKVHMLIHSQMKPPEKPANDKSTDEKQIAMLNQKITQLQETNVAQKQEIERLKTSVIRMEEYVLANEKRLQEKMHECAALGGDLDRARDEAARALARANERTETIRKCLQTTVAELERQLAASRAQVANAEKEREELRSRMQCQIKRLNDNFEQAQLRVFGLQTQVETLRRARPDGDDTDEDDEEAGTVCACKEVFQKS